MERTMMKSKKLKRVLALLLLLFCMGYLYRFSPYKIEFLGHYDKIWAHRANSVEKLQSALNHFEGVELDLVYMAEGNYFDITHPPVPSSGLKLENYLSEIIGEPYLWFDIKNLNTHNSANILGRLLEILQKKKHPLHKVLIETAHPEALLVFNDNGFKTSYYLPSGLSRLNTLDLEIQVDSIKRVLNQQPELGISSSYKDYDFMTEYFPDRDKHLWMIDGIRSHGISTPRKILKDETVKILLINYRAPSGNR